MAPVLLTSVTARAVDEPPPVSDSEETPDFEPVPDRWRIEPPPYELKGAPTPTTATQ